MITWGRILIDFSFEPGLVKYRRVIVDVLGIDSHLGISGQRLGAHGLISSENVEVPHWTPIRLIAVKLLLQVDLTGDRVDIERAVLGKLTSQAVADVGLAIVIGIGRRHLEIDQKEFRWIQEIS